jgi:hypothetical protein
MVGSDADRVVAAMQDEQAVWNCPIVELPGQPVDQRIPFARAAPIENPVPESRRGTGPQPTPFRLADLAPKAGVNGDANTRSATELPRTCSHPGGGGAKRLAACRAVTTKARRPRRFARRLRLAEPLRVAGVASVPVPHVVALCTQQQVRGIDAARVVTLVPEHHADRNGTVRQFPSNAVGDSRAAASPKAGEHAMTEGCRRGEPRPAGIRTAGPVDLRPEQLGEGLRLRSGSFARRGIVEVHRMVPPFGATPEAVPAALRLSVAHFTRFDAKTAA